ncbi:hypothetical protein GCM10010330_76810 [Streptomyces tendae]|nr:hypothetical protein GCM10010330_76810 [Streptomyces tendae]
MRVPPVIGTEDLYLFFRDLFGSPPPGPLDANALPVTAADQAMWDALNWHTRTTEPEGQGREGRRPQPVTHPPTAGVQHRTEFDITTITEPDPAAASGLADTSPDERIDIAGMTGAGAIDDYFRDEAPGHITLANSDVILHLPDGDQERWLPVAQEIANRLPHRVRVPLAGLQGTCSSPARIGSRPTRPPPNEPSAGQGPLTD